MDTLNVKSNYYQGKQLQKLQKIFNCVDIWRKKHLDKRQFT